MYIIEVTLLVLGIALLIVGYRKNNRNVLVTAAVILFLSAGIDSFVSGFKEGFSSAREGQALNFPAQKPNNTFNSTPLRDAA